MTNDTPDAPAPSPIPTLATTNNRYVLRPFTLDDAPLVHEYLSDPRIAQWTLNIAHPYPDGAAEGWIASHAAAVEAGTDITWAIALPEDNRVIGAIGLVLTPRHRRGEIGYWLGTPFWGQGVMTEAAQTVVAYGLNTLGLRRIQATCLPHNVGSYRVMEKAGMTFEGILRDYYLRHGEFTDSAMYAIVAREDA